MNGLLRIWVWLRRIRHSRGFGVQSPSAYHFIRYVVNEHWKYYKYEQIGEGDDKHTRKLGRFYFRLVNWLQPLRVIDFDESAHSYVQYMQAGCQKTQIVTIDSNTIQSSDLLKNDYIKADLFRISLGQEISFSFVNRILSMTREETVIVLEGIHQNKKSQQLWHDVEQDNRTTVMFDLYDCGVVFFDKKRYKHTYIVNF